MKEVFPQNYSVLLIGSPGVGKSEYCLDLTKSYLQNNEKVVYVTTEKSPTEVRKRMKELGIDLEAYEGNSFLFIDVFTKFAGPKDEKALYVDNPANLNMASVRLSEAIAILGKPARIIFDSLSMFFLHASESEIRRFFESINTKIKTDYGFAMYTLQEAMHDEKAVIALKAMVDAVLEMRLEEAPSLRRRFRVLFAKGITYPQDWVEFHITKHGFALSPRGEVPVPSAAEQVVVKRGLPLMKVAVFFFLLLAGIVVLQVVSRRETPQLPTVSPTITPAPPVITAAPTTSPPSTTFPPDTFPPKTPYVEYRLDGMETVNNWLPFEGTGAILDIAESTEFSKAGKSMRIRVEIKGRKHDFSAVLLFNPQLAGYDGLTLWSYVPEPVPVGRLGMVLKEKDGSDYWYINMRSLKKEGWIKDAIPFSTLGLRPGGDNYDENGQLDLDQVTMLGISVGSVGPTSFSGTYEIYLDELNLFKYQNSLE